MTPTATLTPASGVTATNLTFLPAATNHYYTGFLLNWKDNSTNETGFKISLNSVNLLANQDCSNTTYDPSIAALNYTAAANATMHSFSNLTKSSYCAKVVATNTNGDSAPAYSGVINMVTGF